MASGKRSDPRGLRRRYGMLGDSLRENATSTGHARRVHFGRATLVTGSVDQSRPEKGESHPRQPILARHRRKRPKGVTTRHRLDIAGITRRLPAPAPRNRSKSAGGEQNLATDLEQLNPPAP
jgi:hypothetical protein